MDMKQYVTYYSTNYHAAVIPGDKIEAFVSDAVSYLRYITHNRVDASQSEEVKMAVCKLADAYYKYGDKENITAEKVGNYSVSYDKTTPMNKRLYQIAKIYLANTGLLSGGCHYVY